ncbi:hypothetical protein GCM10011328_05860 [Hafnia psychrotolerans]|uniref:Rz1 lytic protein n=1 Tax=Hafnia psychrotolerans TaxID=1477018 RepID=A0ABQ1FYC3_9GAMM|nr:hypothetical protein GCM10011328_05860 [Hafnia psychrotolerans]
MQIPPTPLPANLLGDYPVPVIPDPLLWGQCLTINSQMMTTIEKVNRDKADIRKAEEARQK